MSRERMCYDVVIVGAGPAGFAAAIRLKQLDAAIKVCVLEKGAEVGAHILSGAVLEPRALAELIPDWQARGAPLHTPVTQDQFLLLTESTAYRLPTPLPLRNKGNYIISLTNLCRWLGKQAEALGVEIYPGFAAAEILFDARGNVRGVATGDLGIDKMGKATARFQRGVEIIAQQTLLAEGCRGSLSKQIIQHYALATQASPQTYAIGLKELWQVRAEQHQPGTVIHSIGWPLDQNTYGGGFIYHLENQQVAVGCVIGLDYANPYLNPFEELQRFKLHPQFKPMFAGGHRLAYGARTLVEGGLQALPKLSFPGGLLIGDAAGFLNVPKIKGSHTAMKSGMVAAESIYQAWQQDHAASEIKSYSANLKNSWLWPELHRVRNIRPAFKKGLLPGLLYSALDTYLLRGHAPWTFKHRADHTTLKKAALCTPINYPKPDNLITFDKLSSVYLSNVNHADNQPCHLQLKDVSVPVAINLAEYAAPEQRYCPAAVYEILQDTEKKPYLQINAQNCIHCKACDIKDPTQNIDWTTPEGGGGPGYGEM